MSTALFLQDYDAAPTDVRNALALFLRLMTSPQVRALFGAQSEPFELPEQTRPGDYDKLRASIARQIWEPSTRSELVDRIAKAIAAGWITEAEWRRVISEARRAVDCYRATDGRSGAQFMWKPLGAWCKEVYAAHGVEWRPTAPGSEPDPRTRPALNQTNPGTPNNGTN